MPLFCRQLRRAIITLRRHAAILRYIRDMMRRAVMRAIIIDTRADVALIRAFDTDEERIHRWLPAIYRLRY